SCFTLFADFGLSGLGVREIARHKKETDSYGTNILIFQVFFTLLLIILLGVLLLFMPISYTLKVITFFFGLGLIPLALDMSYIFQAHQKMEYVLVGKAINQGAYLILGLILITFFKNVVFVPISALISGVGGAIITYVILKKIVNFKLKKPHTKIFKVLVIAAIPFVAAEILVQVYRNIDIVMLQFIRDTNEVGYYSSGYKIVNSIILFISLVSVSFFPLISYYFKHDKKQFKQSILLFSQTTGLLSIPLAIGGIIYARQILTLLYGNQLLAGTDVFKVLLLLLIVIPFRLLVLSTIIAADKQHHYMISSAIATIINVILNIILIPRYGMIGAGIAIVVTETVVGTYLVFNCFKLFDYSSDILKKYFLKPTIAAIIMFLIAFKVPNIFVGIPLATLIYFAALYVIKGIPENLKIDDDFDPATLEQQPWFQTDQLATASVEPATPTANPTDISLIDRSDSQSTVSGEEEMPAPRADPIPSTSEMREDESSTIPTISQQEDEPSFFFAPDDEEADMDLPEWLKSLGAETMEPEQEPELQELSALSSTPKAQQPQQFDSWTEQIDRTLSEADGQQWATLEQLENDLLSQGLIAVQPGSLSTIAQETSLSSALAQLGNSSP
ncbi:MAG TPA: oligosaccharide flippase family protein, partial [Methylomirabilota bacterium]|nr:oligosaccharide flippase family protein [Methylomirabilota bacterium]